MQGFIFCLSSTECKIRKIPSSGKDGLSVRNIGKPQVALLFAVLLFMSIHNFARVCPKQGTSFARVSPNRVLILREFLLTGYIISREFPFNRVYNFARVFQAKQGI